MLQRDVCRAGRDVYKRQVVADRAGIFVDAVFHDSAAYTGLPVMLAVLLYTITIDELAKGHARSLFPRSS